MKRTIICAALLAAMIITGAALSSYTEEVTSRTAEKLVRLEEMSHGADKAELVAAAEKISADWETFCANNIFLTNNECAFEISEALLHAAFIIWYTRLWTMPLMRLWQEYVKK